MPAPTPSDLRAHPLRAPAVSPDTPTTRLAAPWLLWVVLATLVPWSALVNLVFARERLYAPLLEASGGWLDPALQVCLPSVAAYLLLFRSGGCRRTDVGWRLGTLPAGLAGGALLWGALQVCAGAPAEWRVRQDVGLLSAALWAPLLGQLLGNALWEETVYRGFVFAQVRSRLEERGSTRRNAGFLAAAASALAFAIPHLPQRVYSGTLGGPAAIALDLAHLFAAGLLLAWLYARTENLWWLVALHGLANAPTLFFEWTLELDPKIVVSLLAVALSSTRGTWLAARRRRPPDR